MRNGGECEACQTRAAVAVDPRSGDGRRIAPRGSDRPVGRPLASPGMTLDGSAADANAARNAHREPGRRSGRQARGALWDLVERSAAARVAIVGAGNGDDALGRSRPGASTLALIDIDAPYARTVEAG